MAGAAGADKSSFWNASEEESRTKTPKIWFGVWNERYRQDGHARCPRKMINEYLGELERMYFQEAAPEESCCNHCNTDLYARLPKPPERTLPVTAPRAGTRGACALPLVAAWCSNEATQLLPPGAELMFDMPADFFMDDRLLWALCNLFNKGARMFDQWKAVAEDLVKSEVPAALLNEWGHPLTAVIAELNRIAPDVYKAWELIKDTAKDKRIAKAA